jgi:hypothetical protein
MAGPLAQAFLSSRSGVLALLLLLPRVSHEITTHKEIWWWVEAGDGDGDAGRERESNAMAAARTASGRPRPFHDERRQGDLDGAFRDLPGTWIVCVT